MRNWFLLAALFVVLLLFAACPQKEKPAAGANGAATSSAPQTGSAEQAVNGAQPSGDTPASTSPDQPQETAATPAGPSALYGEWLALFGRQDEGMLDSAWQQDQRIKFDKQGQVVFTLQLKGQAASVQGVFAAGESGDIKLTLSAAQALKDGLSHVVPLGIGRNEEIGLLKQAGRNEEVGLTESGAVDAAGNITRSITYKLIGDYLILSDKFDHVMVYTRFQAAPPAASEFDGAWTAAFGAAVDIAASAASTNQALSIDLGEQGKFDGTMISGVAVGKIKRGNEIIMATLRPEGGNRLIGVYSTSPYVMVSNDLTLTRDK
jgi:hypothetical protein